MEIGSIVEYRGNADGILFGEHLQIVQVVEGRIIATDSNGCRVWAYVSECRPLNTRCICPTCSGDHR